MIPFQDQLLVAGGNDPYFAVYDPLFDLWTTGTAPSLSHAFGALVADGSTVYVLRGLEEDRVEAYNVDKDTWSVCEWKCPAKLYNLRALSLDF